MLLFHQVLDPMDERRGLTCTRPRDHVRGSFLGAGCGELVRTRHTQGARCLGDFGKEQPVKHLLSNELQRDAQFYCDLRRPISGRCKLTSNGSRQQELAGEHICL